jgi:hypothetical protein
MESETASFPYPTEPTGRTASKKIAALFQPGTLLAGESLDERHRRTLAEPEKRLMLAVLAEAINGFQDDHSARRGNRKRLFDEVQRWILEAQGNWVFGFENICSALALNPEYIREGLVRWQKKQLSNRRSAPLWEGTTVSVRRQPLPKLVRAS